MLRKSETVLSSILGGKYFSGLKGLQVDACPFVNLPEKKRTQWALTRKEMKYCVWVKPELVVQIEFGEWTPDGHLRHSKFIALAENKILSRLRGTLQLSTHCKRPRNSTASHFVAVLLF